MSKDPGSVTRWFPWLREGRPEAVEALWDRYYQRVLAVARRRLRGGPRQAAQDAEDVVLSAFNGLADGAAQGKFDHLSDRSDLWRLLVGITKKKARHRRRWYERRKRLGRPSGDDPADPEALLARVPDQAPAPELSAMMRDQVEHLLAGLDDPILRQVATWKMEGIPNAVIAERLGRTLRTVERKIEIIRLAWERLGRRG